MGTGLAIVFSIVGAILIFCGLLVVRSSYSKMRKWTTVSGFVIGYREVQQGRHYDAQGNIENRPLSRTDFERPSKWTAYDPQVQFTSADGKMISFTSSMGSNRKPYPIGAAIQVLYDPNDAENATIKSFSNLFLPAVFAFLFGLALLGIALSNFLF
jgi:hypothetical protein